MPLVTSKCDHCGRWRIVTVFQCFTCDDSYWCSEMCYREHTGPCESKVLTSEERLLNAILGV